jgi:hypothetical protein
MIRQAPGPAVTRRSRNWGPGHHAKGGMLGMQEAAWFESSAAHQLTVSRDGR